MEANVTAINFRYKRQTPDIYFSVTGAECYRHSFPTLMTNTRHLFLASYGAECYRHSFQTFRPNFLSRYAPDCTILSPKMQKLPRFAPSQYLVFRFLTFKCWQVSSSSSSSLSLSSLSSSLSSSSSSLSSLSSLSYSSSSLSSSSSSSMLSSSHHYHHLPTFFKNILTLNGGFLHVMIRISCFPDNHSFFSTCFNSTAFWILCKTPFSLKHLRIRVLNISYSDLLSLQTLHQRIRTDALWIILEIISL